MNDETPRNESKAECFLTPSWVFKLGPRDSLLVLKALGGRLLVERGEDVAAKELGDRLTLLRESSGREFYRALEHAKTMVEEQK